MQAYEESLASYRAQLRQMLGWPLTEDAGVDVPVARVKKVAKDSLGQISRVWIETLPGVHTYGLYFRPPGRGPFPLAISQHGGGGTPELCSGFFNNRKVYDLVDWVWFDAANRFLDYEGTHELDRSDAGIDFLCRHLGV